MVATIVRMFDGVLVTDEHDSSELAELVQKAVNHVMFNTGIYCPSFSCDPEKDPVLKPLIAKLHHKVLQMQKKGLHESHLAYTPSPAPNSVSQHGATTQSAANTAIRSARITDPASLQLQLWHLPQLQEFCSSTVMLVQLGLCWPQRLSPVQRPSLAVWC